GRLVHGAAQGANWPAANGLIAEETQAGERGRAFGYMQATNMAGMLLGPAIGGFIALLNIGVVFTIAAALSLLTVFALMTLPNVRARTSVEIPARAVHIARRLLPLLLPGAGTAYMIGALDTIWSLYLTSRGANTSAVETAGALAGGALRTLGPAYAFLSIPAVCLEGAATAFVPRPREAMTAHETPYPDPDRPASDRGACAGPPRPPHLPRRADARVG